MFALVVGIFHPYMKEESQNNNSLWKTKTLLYFEISVSQLRQSKEEELMHMLHDVILQWDTQNCFALS
jgi:hypothetical protein